MQFSNTFGGFLVTVLSASLAAGAVIPFQDKPVGSFEVKRARNTAFTGRNGPLALARAYAKYGVPISESLVKAVDQTFERLAARHSPYMATRGVNGTVPATPDNNDLEYLVNVQIGTPAQTLKLDFDTGSSDLWVFSTQTPSASDGSHTLYNPSKSSTSKKMQGATWTITYGDNSSSSGDVYTDVVTVGGLSVNTQAVESAEKVSSQFVSGESDGLLGLGWSSINTVTPQQQQTWFANIAGSLDSPLFVADLKHDTPGSYIFGSIPSEASSVQYAPVDNSQGFWQFTSSTSSIGSFSAIADTGTTLLLGSDAMVKDYYKNVQGAENDAQQGGYVFPCSASLPDFTFTVGSGSISVPGSLINYAPATGSQCFGGIQSSGGLPFAILGDIALKAAYVVFDQGQTRLGWAQK